jgi:hypothetical protein
MCWESLENVKLKAKNEKLTNPPRQKILADWLIGDWLIGHSTFGPLRQNYVADSKFPIP